MDPSVPEECYAIRQTFFECKHSIVSILFEFEAI